MQSNTYSYCIAGTNEWAVDQAIWHARFNNLTVSIGYTLGPSTERGSWNRATGKIQQIINNQILFQNPNSAFKKILQRINLKYIRLKDAEIDPFSLKHLCLRAICHTRRESLNGTRLEIFRDQLDLERERIINSTPFFFCSEMAENNQFFLEFAERKKKAPELLAAKLIALGNTPPSLDPAASSNVEIREGLHADLNEFGRLMTQPEEVEDACLPALHQKIDLTSGFNYHSTLPNPLLAFLKAKRDGYIRQLMKVESSRFQKRKDLVDLAREVSKHAPYVPPSSDLPLLTQANLYLIAGMLLINSDSKKATILYSEGKKIGNIFPWIGKNCYFSFFSQLLEIWLSYYGGWIELNTSFKKSVMDLRENILTDDIQLNRFIEEQLKDLNTRMT